MSTMSHTCFRDIGLGSTACAAGSRSCLIQNAFAAVVIPRMTKELVVEAVSDSSLQP